MEHLTFLTTLFMFSLAGQADYVRATRVPVISMVFYRLHIISNLFLWRFCVISKRNTSTLRIFYRNNR